jgi:hypothetical protein
LGSVSDDIRPLFCLRWEKVILVRDFPQQRVVSASIVGKDQERTSLKETLLPIYHIGSRVESAVSILLRLEGFPRATWWTRIKRYSGTTLLSFLQYECSCSILYILIRIAHEPYIFIKGFITAFMQRVNNRNHLKCHWITKECNILIIKLKKK